MSLVRFDEPIDDDGFDVTPGTHTLLTSLPLCRKE